MRRKGGNSGGDCAAGQTLTDAALAADIGPVRLSWRETGLVALVVLVSLLSSVTLTLALSGPTREAMIPAAAIPVVVSWPVAYLMLRQHARMRALNLRLHHMLRHDALTGLLTRRAFLGDVEAETARLGGLLMMIDVDEFKQINDRFGHAAGDDVLCEIGRSIVRACPRAALVSRFGGEEFAVFLPGLPADAGAAMADLLLSHIREAPIQCEGIRIRATISVGYAPLAAGGQLSGALLAADDALYAAKRSGRDRAFSAPAPPAMALAGLVGHA